MLGLIGAGGIVSLLSGGLVGTALSVANSAKTSAELALERLDNLIIQTDIEITNTSNYVLNTSNILYNHIVINSNLLNNRIINNSNVLNTRIFDTSNFLYHTSNLVNDKININSNV